MAGKPERVSSAHCLTLYHTFPNSRSFFFFYNKELNKRMGIVWGGGGGGGAGGGAKVVD